MDSPASNTAIPRSASSSRFLSALAASAILVLLPACGNIFGPKDFHWPPEGEWTGEGGGISVELTLAPSGKLCGKSFYDNTTVCYTEMSVTGRIRESAASTWQPLEGVGETRFGELLLSLAPPGTKIESQAEGCPDYRFDGYQNEHGINGQILIYCYHKVLTSGGYYLLQDLRTATLLLAPR